MGYLTTHTSLSPIWRGFTPGFVNYKKGCTQLAAASDKVYQLLAHGRWFSPGTPASSITKTGRHDIAEILLKVALNTKKKSINLYKGSVLIQYNNRKSTYIKAKTFDNANFYKTTNDKVLSIERLYLLHILQSSCVDDT